MKTMSMWERESRRLAAATLSNLPPNATWKDKRKALRNAYPFGARKNHPYRVWLTVLREMMGPPPSSGILSGVCFTPDGVTCTHCAGAKCFECLPAHLTLLASPINRDHWRQWLALVAEDPTARLPLADWLEENGLDEAAAQQRNIQ